MNHALVSGIVVDGKFGNGVFVVRHVVAQCPLEILGCDGVRCQREFHTLVFQRTHVGQYFIAEVGAGWCRNGVQQVVGLTIIEIQRTREYALEDSKVEASVVGCGLFPLQILVVSQWRDKLYALVTEVVIGSRL